MSLWLAAAALAQDAEPAEVESTDPEASPDDDDPISRYRTPFGVLTERTIGTTSRPVEFNWRRTRVHLAVTAHHVFELNNFNTLRGGGMVRLPSGGVIFELGVDYVHTWDTYSSRIIALTPYRQPGHPSHLGLDFNVALPFAEGVVTTWPRIFPAVEMVFNGYAGLRYGLYPTAFKGMTLGNIAGAVLSPQLTEAEVVNLQDARLEAMQVDTGRYGLTFGFGNDLYFKQGFFVSPRLLMSMPLLAPASQTNLVLWADISIAVGLAL